MHVAASLTSELGLWHTKTGPELARSVKATTDTLERTQSPRRKRMARNLSLYEQRPLNGLDPNAYFTTDELVHADFDVLRVNVARMLVNAAHAKIAGKQRPKTQFVVTDGDWSTKRKAKKLERFVEAHMLQRQGPTSDGWEQSLKAMLHACICDIGAVKTTANMATKKIDIRAVLPWEILADPMDARDGMPLSLFQIYPVDKWKLAADFPKFKRQILAAGDATGDGVSRDYFGRSSDISRMVLVREAWRLRLGENSPGVHAICVGDADITGGEQYDRDFFPFEFYVWEQWIQGLYGTSIVDNVYHLTMEANASIQRMADAERYGSNQIIDCEKGSYDKEKLDGNIAKSIIERNPGTAPINVFTPNAISSSTVQWWQLLVGTSHDVSGVSEMAATGERQPGVDSGAAMRTLTQIGTERFSVQWQAYERRTAVGQARQILACAREIAAVEPNYAVKWPGKQFLQEFKASDLGLGEQGGLEEDMYVIQPYPVSGTYNTPPDRLATGNELYDRQIISGAALARIQLSKDVEGEIAGTGTWARLIERYIESWLDATKESEARGAAGDEKAFRYRPPVKWMPLTEVIVQCGRAYAEAEMDGAPDYNLQFFIKFMGDCDREIQKMDAQAAVNKAAAGGAANVAPPPDLGAGAGGPVMGAPPPMPPPMGLPPGEVLQ